MQPQKTRSRIRIYYDILLSVMEEGNAKPTRVLYKANLSYDRLVKYLDELISKGLLQERACIRQQVLRHNTAGSKVLGRSKKG